MKNKKPRKSKRKRNFISKSKQSNIQPRHVVGPKDFRKKKYMRDPFIEQTETTYYPERKNKSVNGSILNASE